MDSRLRGNDRGALGRPIRLGVASLRAGTDFFLGYFKPLIAQIGGDKKVSRKGAKAQSIE